MPARKMRSGTPDVLYVHSHVRMFGSRPRPPHTAVWKTDEPVSPLRVCAQYHERPERGGYRVSHAVVMTNTVMILPQVHLRKPCYDFYFL